MGLSIKEASERLEIPPHTIRYYEKEGLLPFIQRDEHGNRIFGSTDLDEDGITKTAIRAGYRI